ncbi:MAG TPA: tetratricopeptide repeat protein [Azospirillaceae bacterium]|nr:tetratricopeptide repeat protein [Azospirillaceae bacterium]
MSSPKDSLNEAIQHLRAGRANEAEEICRQFLIYNPDDPDTFHLMGVIAGQTNRPAEALRLFDKAIGLIPDNPSFHNSRGSLLYQIGQFADAEGAFRRAVELAAGYAELHNNLGNTLRSLGRLDEAEGSFRRALALRPDAADLHHNLGGTLRELGRLDEALAALRRAVELDPSHIEAWYHLGDACYERFLLEEAEICHRHVIEAVPQFVLSYVGLAHVLQNMNRLEEAMDVLQQGMEQVPGHPLLAFTARLIYSQAVPGWHLPMINDHERNEAYLKAVERAVTPDAVVLEIGTGSGIVAMMAARAGAKHVYTCEVNTALARVARATVARNGLSDRVTVIPKLSTQMEVGGDLPEKADVFVSELINIGMLAPNMLAVLQHARANLVKPGARIIPAASTVYGMLVQADELARLNPVREICGFDMSTFDIFRSPGYIQIDLGADEHVRLSEDFAALEFDFTRAMAERDSRILEIKATAEGLCHGVAFWFDLHMDEEVVYASASRKRANHWKQAMHFFDEPIPVKAGDTIKVHACYDNNRIFFVGE